jgi:hypothetical protein
MNIKDVSKSAIDVPDSPRDMLREIFLEQQDLMKKYQEIEEMPPWPMDFQHKGSQIWFKNFMWRAHEELAEAEEALTSCDLKNPALCIDHIIHFYEELSDALHFMIELMIVADVSPYMSRTNEDVLSSSFTDDITVCSHTHTLYHMGSAFFTTGPSAFFNRSGELREVISNADATIFNQEISIATDLCRTVSYLLGLAGNVLKHKQWKQTAVMSDKDAFNNRIKMTLQAFFVILKESGFTPREAFLLYMSKKMVNSWRQNTNY